jgi:hypothetical protein
MDTPIFASNTPGECIRPAIALQVPLLQRLRVVSHCGAEASRQMRDRTSAHKDRSGDAAMIFRAQLRRCGAGSKWEDTSPASALVTVSFSFANEPAANCQGGLAMLFNVCGISIQPGPSAADLQNRSARRLLHGGLGYGFEVEVLVVLPT